MLNEKILMVTAVEAERDAVKLGLRDDPRFDVIVAGVGQTEAAVSTTVALTKESYTTVISTGIAGGFAEQAELESIVVANEIRAVDFGAETDGGFQTVESLHLGNSHYVCDESLIEKVSTYIKKAGIRVQTGPILTASTVTGTAKTAEELARRVPGAAAEAMEGFGVATAAQRFDVPVFELRAISNVVGPRDRDNWKMKESLALLTEAMKVLREVL